MIQYRAASCSNCFFIGKRRRTRNWKYPNVNNSHINRGKFNAPYPTGLADDVYYGAKCVVLWYTGTVYLDYLRAHSHSMSGQMHDRRVWNSFSPLCLVILFPQESLSPKPLNARMESVDNIQSKYYFLEISAERAKE